jgi:flagellar assembly protein FliH
MSLSKFYRNSDSFQAKSVLDKKEAADNSPVWGSIVKDEPAAVPQETTTEETLPEVLDTVETPVTDPVTEPIIDAPPLEELSPVEIPASPVQPEVTVDIGIIEQNAFASGIEAGKKQAEEDFENSAQTLLCICTELDALRETILRNSSGEMKELVIAISEKIIRHSVSEQNETIIATIKDAINLAVKSDEFEIQVNPDDLAVIQKFKQEILDSISGLDNIVLKPDPSLERGGCKLESSSCTVDASMTSQIKVIHDSIMAAENLSELTKVTETKESLIEE